MVCLQGRYNRAGINCNGWIEFAGSVKKEGSRSPNREPSKLAGQHCHAKRIDDWRPTAVLSVSTGKKIAFSAGQGPCFSKPKARILTQVEARARLKWIAYR